jgi:hypothetical protein
MAQNAERAQVKIQDVYLYTQWGAAQLESDVARALKQGESRWSDSESLTRIIFCALIGETNSPILGFGIGTVKHANINKLLSLSFVKRRRFPLRPYRIRRVVYNPIEMDEKNVKYSQSWTFEEFLEVFK